MEIVDNKYDEAINNIIKVYLAQMNSAMKISKIICEHSGEEGLSGDHIICGLIYRLMVPMSDDEMLDSLANAENLLNDTDSDSDEEGYESDEDEYILYEIPKEKRSLKMNNCSCEICVKCRECIAGYESYETYDPMVTRFKDSIRTTCEKHNIYIN